MSLLDLGDDNCEKYSIEALNSLATKFLEEHGMIQYVMCGFMGENYTLISKLPEDFDDWYLCACEGVNNHGSHCCVFYKGTTPNFYIGLTLYDIGDFRACYVNCVNCRGEIRNIPQYITIKYILDWYNNK